MATTERAPRITEPIHPDLITREQAASMIGCSMAKIAATQPFYEYRIGPRFIRIDRREVEAYLTDRKSA